jgi:L-amino acid N-acyltransferase YncA
MLQSGMASPEVKPQLTVRPAHDADAQALREIFNEAVEDGLATFDTSPRSIEQQKLLILSSQLNPRNPVLVAEVRNWVCGYLAIERPDGHRSHDDAGEVAVFVRRAFRSYGVGRQLMRVAQAEAARLGYRKLLGWVLAENHDSLRLCQATGWRTVGTLEQHARHGESFRDVTLVEYHVTPAAQAE